MQNSRDLENVEHKLKTHQQFDLPRSQTVQREIRLHENGSFLLTKASSGQLQKVFENVPEFVYPTRYSLNIAHCAIINVHVGIFETLKMATLTRDGSFYLLYVTS